MADTRMYTKEQLQNAKHLATAISKCKSDQQSVFNIAMESMLVGVAIAEQQFSAYQSQMARPSP